MKRTFAKLLSLFVVLTLVIAMVPAVFAVDGTVSVTAGNTTLKVGDTTRVSVTDANGTAVPNVTLSSDHDDIVSVIDSSTIKALKVGSATITATVTEDGETQTLGSVQITVKLGVTAIAPANETIEIDADNAKTASLSVTLTGAASGDVLAVQSSDESVVTAQAGSITLPGGTCTVTLTAVKTGTATVTLSCGTATAQVAVTVKATKDHTVTFEKQKLTVKKGETAMNPAKATAGDKLTYASSNTAVAAVKEDGTVVVWGTCTNGENNVPAFESKPVELYGGRYHFTALMDDGEVISWGDNTHGQASVPASFNEKEIVTVYAGFYQNYAVTVDGDVETWGLKGYVCGTDDLGRDVFNRIINGGKVTMTVGAISVIIQLVIGIILGGLAGYFGGWVDNIIMRISEVVGGLPFLPFAMILSAIIGTRITVEQRMYLIMVVLGVLSWPGICHLIRAQILSQREQEYVTAAQALGVREKNIIFHHIIPNVMSLILVNATLSFATCMLTESSLSYMGFGIAPPTPTWGNMLTGANNSIVIQQYWWRWVFPAAIFGICTICINLVGDALRDAVDPKSAER